MTLELAGKGRLSDLFGDFVVFRRMEPADRRLPSVAAVWREIGLESPRPPRKRERAYGKAAAWLLRRMQNLVHPGAPLRELVFIGDTAGDVNAFRLIKSAAGWNGAIFVGKDIPDGENPLRREGDDLWRGSWSSLLGWGHALMSAGLGLDEGTAVVVDIDKTAIGARGRNNGAIDRARLAAMQTVISEVLGEHFDPERFAEAYRELNQARYHLVTEDNQDYLAYTCLAVSAGVISPEALCDAIESGRFSQFGDFIRWAGEQHAMRSIPGLWSIHQEVVSFVERGDPTPFKAFRHEELRQTVLRMGNLDAPASMDERMREEICITGEVWLATQWLLERGALVTSFSDKPEEASLAPPDDDIPSVHQVETDIVMAEIPRR